MGRGAGQAGRRRLPLRATDCMDEDTIAKAVKATIDDANTAADAALARIGTTYQLCFNFLDYTGLSL